MNEEELKNTIRKLHRVYYCEDVLKSPQRYLEFHGFLQELFNYAEITETLAVNNPDQISTSQLEFAIKQGWIKKNGI